VRMPDFLPLGSRGNEGLVGAIAPDYRCKVMEAPSSSFGGVERCRRAAWPRHGRNRQRGAMEAPTVEDTACSELREGAAVSAQMHDEHEASTVYDCRSMLRWRFAASTAEDMLDSSKLVSVLSKNRCRLLARFETPTWEVPLMTAPSDRPASPDLKADLKKLSALPLETPVTRIPLEAPLTKECTTSETSSMSDSDSPTGCSTASASRTSEQRRVVAEGLPDLKWRGSTERLCARSRVASPDVSTMTGGDTPTSLLSSEEFSSSPRHKPQPQPREKTLECHPISCTCSSCMKMRSFVGLLNKISARNESVIVEQLSLLSPCNIQEQCKMARLIMQQALRDPLHGDLYGRTITALSIIFPQFSSLGLSSLQSARREFTRRVQPRGNCNTAATRPRPVSFAAQVVRCLEDEFDEVCHGLQDLDDKAQQSEKDGQQSEATEILEASQQAKDRALACVKFVAKLVLCDVLSERLLSEVVLKLLWRKEKGPEDAPPASFIECACELLSITLGPLRWRDREPEALHLVLDRLAWLKELRLTEHSQTFVYPKRVRYIVLNLLEVHADKIDEIHRLKRGASYV